MIAAIVLLLLRWCRRQDVNEEPPTWTLAHYSRTPPAPKITRSHHAHNIDCQPNGYLLRFRVTIRFAALNYAPNVNSGRDCSRICAVRRGSFPELINSIEWRMRARMLTRQIWLLARRFRSRSTTGHSDGNWWKFVSVRSALPHNYTLNSTFFLLFI